MKLSEFKKQSGKEAIIIKVGTDLIADEDGLPNIKVMENIIDQIVIIQEQYNVILVSSGAVCFGRALRGKKKSEGETVGELQDFFSIGQPELIATYRDIARNKELLIAQSLLTKNNFLNIEQHRNLRRNLMHNLLNENSTLPIVNENDTVATQELMFTDNDQLAGCLTRSLQAKQLIIASTVNGLLEDIKNPNSVIPKLTMKDKKMAYSMLSDEGSQNGKGEMKSKLDVGYDLLRKRIPMNIVHGNEPNGLVRLVIDEEQLGTRFENS